MSVELVLPSERYRPSFLAAEQELVAADEADDAPITDATFAALLEKFANDRAGNVAAHRVPETTLWLVEADAFIGRIAVRHRLNERLEVYGGHIGYDVRPSRRREGHGTRMLALALPHARALGIAHAVLTCDEDNLASRKIIEKNGGVLDARYPYEGTIRLRYRIPTTSGA